MIKSNKNKEAMFKTEVSPPVSVESPPALAVTPICGFEVDP